MSNTTKFESLQESTADLRSKLSTAKFAKTRALPNAVTETGLKKVNA
jgi:hypothetical protein